MPRIVATELEQTGFDGAELAAFDVVHRGQPAEDVLAFRQRHDDQLADLRARPAGLLGDRPVDHHRLMPRIGPKVGDQLGELGVVDRALSVAQQHRLGAGGVAERLAGAGQRHQLDRQPGGRHNLLHPLQRDPAQVLVALRELQVLRQPIEQADLFVGRGEVDRQAVGFLLQVAGALAHAQMVQHQIADAFQGLGRSTASAGAPRPRVP